MQQLVHTVPLDVVKPPAVAVLVNFGLVAGRKPTRRELEELAAELRQVVPVLSIVDEQRLEVGAELEVLLEEVRIEVFDAGLAASGLEAAEAESRILAAAERWLTRCAADPGEPANLAERIARQAVVEVPGPPP